MRLRTPAFCLHCWLWTSWKDLILLHNWFSLYNMLWWTKGKRILHANNVKSRTFMFDPSFRFFYFRLPYPSAETFITFVCLKLERLRERAEGYERIFKKRHERNTLMRLKPFTYSLSHCCYNLYKTSARVF